MLLKLVLVLVFGAVVLLVLGLGDLVTGERQLVRARLLRYTAPEGEKEERLARRRKTLGRAVLRQGGRFFASLKFAEKVEAKLARADLPLRGEEFLFLNFLLAAGAPLLFWLFTNNLSLAIPVGLVFLLAPWFYLESVQQRRLHAFNNQLSDALVVMTNSLRAGYSFLQAMEMVAREMPPPLADEFSRTLREMQLGTATEAALSNLARRVGSEDLDLIIVALLIQRQIGGNLAEILDNIAETIRERVRIKGEIKTLTAQGRLSGLIIGLLPVVLLVILFLINPVYIGLLFTEPLGLILLGGAALGEIMGVFLLRRIVDIRV
ncbi:MAG: type II secretion system F family protein [Bacillota bacterium]|jgi:tight adherence protein B|nr:type II secretion system F family protein [Bacillota bacterium]